MAVPPTANPDYPYPWHNFNEIVGAVMLTATVRVWQVRCGWSACGGGGDNLLSRHGSDFIRLDPEEFLPLLIEGNNFDFEPIIVHAYPSMTCVQELYPPGL